MNSSNNVEYFFYLFCCCDDIFYHGKWLLRWYLLPWQMITTMISVTMTNDYYDDICYHGKWLLRWYLLPWQMITTMLYYHEEAMTSNWHLRCKAKQWFLKNYCKHMKNGWKDEFYTCFFMVKSRLRVNDKWHLLAVNCKWEWYISFFVCYLTVMHLTLNKILVTTF